MNDELTSTLWGLFLLAAALLPSILQVKKKRDEARRQAGRTQPTTGGHELADDRDNRQRSLSGQEADQTVERRDFAMPDNWREQERGLGSRDERGFTTLDERRNSGRDFTSLDNRRQYTQDSPPQTGRSQDSRNDNVPNGGEDTHYAGSQSTGETTEYELIDYADAASAQRTQRTAGGNVMLQDRRVGPHPGNGLQASGSAQDVRTDCAEDLPAEFNLRHAVIYAEILKPKFGPQSED